MESKESAPDLGESGGIMLSKPTQSRPMLFVPPRSASDALARASADATPSPMTFASSFFAEQDSDPDCKSFSQLLAGAMVTPSPKFTDIFNDSGVLTSRSQSINQAPPVESKVSAGTGNPGRSSTARFKTMTPARLPIPRSPYLTIPPGLSPTTLLDSPVLLSTGQAEPSPTTGTFPLPPFIHGSGPTCVSASDTFKEQYSDQDGSPTFVFKPFPKLGTNSLPPHTSLGPFGLSHQQALAQVQAQAQAQVHESSPASEMKTIAASSISSLNAAKFVAPMDSRGPVESTSQALFESSVKPQHLQPHACPPNLVERPSEDGYNWRKYGQKQVKGSEFPRSYYKCTHPNCPVKKKVERSYDGQVTEIVYKGEHNHPKPQGTRRSSASASHLLDGSGREGSFSFSVPGKFEGSNAIMKVNGSAQVDAKGEIMSTISDPSFSSKGPFVSGANGTPEPSSGSTSDDDDGSKIEDGDDNEPDSKRRKRERASEAVAVAPLRTIREPRVVVQTTSDVDILDDGYRWRKYGQKVVKGNPHPRSYYKCTNHGCSVRKHVERSSTDSKAVITTYEGKHNHDVPAARNSGHSNQENSRAAAITSAAPHHIGFSGSTVAKPSVSLQDQFLYGKLLEDRLKAAASERMTMGLELSSDGLISGPLVDQHSRIQEVTDISSQVPMNLTNSAIVRSRSLETAGSYMQNLLLRPKEEQGDTHLIGSSLEPTFTLNPVCQGMLLGP